MSVQHDTKGYGRKLFVLSPSQLRPEQAVFYYDYPLDSNLIYLLGEYRLKDSLDVLQKHLLGFFIAMERRCTSKSVAFIVKEFNLFSQ